MRIVSQVIYTQHGGSGFHLSYNDCMMMELSELFWWAERLIEYREAEADAIRKSRG